ncbi:MAG TPA: 4a-hydroxytetrahydrobiopterin dehydratase [Acidimicrobiales bacterium]|nr:4a-hydroxytetrahydrobiopterin dehydratase [Acidimicrobiales bacterium]
MTSVTTRVRAEALAPGGGHGKVPAGSAMVEAVELLDIATVDEAVAGGLGWQRSGNELIKTWSGKDFAAALAYVNEVARLAEGANHHPDIDIRWNKVVLRLSTHSAGGLTQADLDLAHQLDTLGA